MNELVATLLVVLFGTLPVLTSLRRYQRREGQLFVFSLFAHVFSAWALIWVYAEFYEGGDIANYYYVGHALSLAMSDDFVRVTPEIIKLIFHQPIDLAVRVSSAGTSTGTMCGFCGLILFCVNNSLYALGMVIGFISFAGKMAIYEVLRDSLPSRHHARMLVASMLIPSVVFWSAGVTKEAFALSGLGVMFLGMHRIVRRERWGPIMIGLGAIVIGLVKPYILFPFVVASAVWFYWARSIQQSGKLTIRPQYLAAGALFAIVGVIGLGYIFPMFSLSSVGDEAAYLQEVGQFSEGGSNYSIGNTSDRSITGQLLYSPLALFTSLFRPLPFEARSGFLLVNAVETTTITGLLLWALWTRSWLWMLRTVTASPVGMFCLTFTLMLGVGVGLSTTNLGTLSRYRMPLVPFYSALVVLWSAPVPSGLLVTAPRLALRGATARRRGAQ